MLGYGCGFLLRRPQIYTHALNYQNLRDNDKQERGFIKEVFIHFIIIYFGNNFQIDNMKSSYKLHMIF